MANLTGICQQISEVRYKGKLETIPYLWQESWLGAQLCYCPHATF